MRNFMCVLFVAVLFAGCHDTGVAPGAVGKEADGSTVSAPGVGGTACAVDWNEWQDTNGRAHVGWVAADENPASVAGCAQVQACLVYVWSVDPVEINTLCTETASWPSSPAYGAGFGVPGVDPADAFVTIINNGTFTETTCHIHVTDNNVDPSGICPDAIPIP